MLQIYFELILFITVVTIIIVVMFQFMVEFLIGCQNLKSYQNYFIIYVNNKKKK